MYVSPLEQLLLVLDLVLVQLKAPVSTSIDRGNRKSLLGVDEDDWMILKKIKNKKIKWFVLFSVKLHVHVENVFGDAQSMITP